MSRLAKTRSTTGLATAFVLFVAGVAFTASRNAAGDVYADQEEQSKVEIGLRIAPVPLNMSRKSRELVGLGSYIVNALADCNGCHTASSQETYVFGGVPFFRSEANHRQSGRLFGWRSGLRNLGSTGSDCTYRVAQSHARQNGATGGWPHVRRIQNDHADGCRSGPHSSHLRIWCHGHIALRAAAI
jgi:hypothetical protein